MTTTVEPVEAITLPTWTDPTSVAVLLTAVVSMVTGVLSALHPGFTLPSVVNDSVPAVSLVIAGVAILLNVIRHARASTAAMAALASGKLVVAARRPKVLMRTPVTPPSVVDLDDVAATFGRAS